MHITAPLPLRILLMRCSYKLLPNDSIQRRPWQVEHLISCHALIHIRNDICFSGDRHESFDGTYPHESHAYQVKTRLQYMQVCVMLSTPNDVMAD